MYHIQLSLNVARLQALSMAKSKYMTNPISTIQKEILSLKMEAIVLLTFLIIAYVASSVWKCHKRGITNQWLRVTWFLRNITGDQWLWGHNSSNFNRFVMQYVVIPDFRTKL